MFCGFFNQFGHLVIYTLHSYPCYSWASLCFHPNPGRVCLFVGGKRWGEGRPPEKRWHLGWVLKVGGGQTLVSGWVGYRKCRVPDTWSIGVGQTGLFNSFWTEGLWKEMAFARHWAPCPKHCGDTGVYVASELMGFAQHSSVAQSCPTLCDPMDCSMPGLPVHHQLLELTQTHVHWVGDAIQPSHPLSSPSPPAFNLSQHQGLFQWVSSLHQVAKVLQFQLQHQSFQWIFRTDLP